MWLFIFVFFASFLYAEEAEDFCPSFSEKGEQFPIANIDGEPSSIVGGCVNVITGDYVEMSQDFVVPGSLPLTIERSYSSSDASKGYLSNSWHLNLAGIATYALYEDLMHWKGPHGREISFLHSKKSQKYTYNIDPRMLQRGVTNNSTGHISGKTNVKNCFLKVDSSKKYFLTVFMGDGTSVNLRNSPAGSRYYAITSEVKPNKMAMVYKYKKNSLMGIDVLNTRNELQQTVTFRGEKIKGHNRSRRIKITGSDGREMSYTVRAFKYKVDMQVLYRHFVTEVDRIDQPKERYEYEKIGAFERVVKKELPEGRVTKIRYYLAEKQHDGVVPSVKATNRVYKIEKPIGSDVFPKVAYRFTYHFPELYKKRGICGVYDAYGNKTDYCWDDNLHLTNVHRFARDGTIYSQDMLFWGNDEDLGNIKSRLYSCLGENIFCRNYCYDDRGNVVVERLYGNLSGQNDTPLLVDYGGVPVQNGTEFYEKSYVYSNDGRNLLLGEIDGDRKKSFVYEDGTNKLIALFTYYFDKIVLRQFYKYDENCNITMEIVDNGSSVVQEDLTDVSYRKVICTTYTKRAPFGMPETVEEYCLDVTKRELALEKKVVNSYNLSGKMIRQDHFGSSGFCAYSLFWKYDIKDRLILEVDALGNTIVREYDENNNLTKESGPNHNVVKRFMYDYSNRLVAKIEEHPEGVFATHYVYDLLGQKIQEIDRYGNTTHFVYDEFGRMAQVIFPTINGIQSTIYRSFDGMGNVTAKNENGNLSFAKYNIRGKPTEIIHPDKSSERFVYNLRGLLIAKVDRNGCATCYQHDYQDRITKTKFFAPDGNLLWETSAVYDAFKLIAETDAMGHVTHYSYDIYGRKTKIQKGNSVETFEYDTLGRVVLQATFYDVNDAIVKTTKYDLLNHVLQEKIGDLKGQIVHRADYAYDAEGHCIRTVTYGENSTSQIQETFYNTHGQVCRSINPSGDVTLTRPIFGFVNEDGQHVACQEVTDPQGNVFVTVKDARGRDAVYETKNPFGELIQKQSLSYDLSGNLIKIVETVFGNAEKQIISFSTYDGMGQITSFTEAFGSPEQKTTRYVYASGKLYEIEKPSGKKIHHTYHPDGLLADFSSDDFVYHYSYDRSQRLISGYDNKTGFSRYYDENDCLVEERQGDLVLQYRYDFSGRRTHLILPDGSEVKYSYEGPLLKIISKNISGKEMYRHSYDAHDYSCNVLSQTMIGKAGTSHKSYDLMNRLRISRTNFTEEKILAYDSQGNPLCKEMRDAIGVASCKYSYDHLYQLTSETGFSSHTYSYDSLYNRLSKDSSTYNVNDLNQILSQAGTIYSYDADGNLIKETTADETIEYTYDTIGRLISSIKNGQLTMYAYDCLNRRISKTNSQTIYFLYDDQNEIGAFENGNMTQLRILGEGVGAEIGATVAVELNGRSYAPIHDLSGSVIALIDTDCLPFTKSLALFF